MRLSIKICLIVLAAYFAAAVYGEVQYRVAQMRRGVESVVTVAQTTASRDFSFHDISCRRGDEIALADGELVCVSSDSLDALRRGCAIVTDTQMAKAFPPGRPTRSRRRSRRIGPCSTSPSSTAGRAFTAGYSAYFELPPREAAVTKEKAWFSGS